MTENAFDMGQIDIAWCPGCGNYGLLAVLKQALSELEIKPEQLVMVSGIGQAAKIPHYMKGHIFNGLHGRALPPATAIKASNPDLWVIAESGDGDMYGEGGNHFIHAIRRNPNITNIVHNNMVYGLTKGQASPTSSIGFKTPVQVNGVSAENFNPIAVAIALNASFVARVFSGDAARTKEILKQGILHKGYALIDVFLPCVTFNKVNTYQWFKDNTYYLEEAYQPDNQAEAFKRALERDKYPLGIFYVNPHKPVFEETTGVYQTDSAPLFKRDLDKEKLSRLLSSKR